MLAALGSILASIFGTSVAWWLALKALLVLLIMIVLPIIVKNLMYWLMTGVLLLVTSYTGSASSTIVSLTGIAGYLASGMGIPAAFAVIVSAVATRFTLRLIPFVRL